MNRPLLTTICLFFASVVLLAQPNGTGTYYQKAHGKKGRELKTAMYEIIKNPSVVHYDSLWKAYVYTDMRPEGYLWDMYSNITRYTDPTDKNMHKNSSEGSGINREHSMPKSWFNGMKPAYSDITHVIPTDGWLNNMRSDKPYGETNNPTKGSNGYFSKYGKCSVEGYSGDIFEPNDEFKGDLARIYFYMATCYEKDVATFSSPMFGADSYWAYSSWAMPMLMKWAANDPVSEKEIARNEAVYKLQGNRNPFVDYPDLVDYVWGDKSEEGFSYDGSDASEPLPLVAASSCEINLNKDFFNSPWSGVRSYYDRIPLIAEQNGITVIYAYGEGKNMYCNDKQIRLYTDNVLTFKTDKDNITDIVLNVVKNDQNRVFTASSGTIDGYHWTGEATEVNLSLEYASKGVVQLNKATITVANPSGIEQLMAERFYDDNIYTLQGVRVDADQLRPGIYIKHGRKFVVK